MVGHGLQDGDRVLIVEDVTTAGTSISETVPILRAAARVSLAGLIVSVDRMEKAPHSQQSALKAVGTTFGMPARALVPLDAILDQLAPDGDLPQGHWSLTPWPSRIFARCASAYSLSDSLILNVSHHPMWILISVRIAGQK